MFVLIGRAVEFKEQLEILQEKGMCHVYLNMKNKFAL